MADTPKYEAYSERLIKKLTKGAPQLEWSTGIIDVKGKMTRIVEAYNPETNLGIGISLGEKPTTREIDITVNTILAQARKLVEEGLETDIIREELSRR
jgi:hypothetical protein